MKWFRVLAWRGAVIMGLAMGRMVAESPTLGSKTGISGKVRMLTPATRWVERPSVRLQFDAYHPQGLARAGGHFFVSTVEVHRRPRPWNPPRAGFDRDAGSGVGHLLQFDDQGTLKADVRLGGGSIYHPGGMDSDGESLWVPVAEYRPGGRSRVYRVPLATLRAEEVLTMEDHIGAVAYDPVGRVLHGVSWGSRDYYHWTIPSAGGAADMGTPPENRRRRNPSFYIDYQDCKWVGDGFMVCAGVRNYGAGSGTGGGFSLGGIELVEAEGPRVVHQVPVERRSPAGRVLTHNAFWMESIPDGLRAWFVPDDGRSEMRVFDLVHADAVKPSP